MANLFPANRNMEDFEKNIFGNMFPSLFDNNRQMSVDIKEKDNHYEVDADIPGFEKDNIQVEYDDTHQILSIQAKKETSTEKKDDEKQYLHRERSTQSYMRQFTLPNVDSNGIKAKYDKGVLHLTLPKKEENTKDKKQISIE